MNSTRLSAEWRSQVVPRYQRRSERVDAAILGVYLSGINTRRIKGALAPLLRGGRTGQVKLRKIDGWRGMAPVKEAA